MSHTRTPLSVLTGFLGSGKTTLLSMLLRHPGMAGSAVLINELGEIALDGALVARADESMVVLAGGCICCTVRGDLVESLLQLGTRAAAGSVPAFLRVVIETTGLADPAPILHTLMTEPRIAARFRLDGVVATVDALHGNRQLDEHFESVKQAAVADRIVLSKTDLVDPCDAAALVKRLRGINPAAAILPAVMGAIEPARLFDAGLYDPARKSLDVQRWLREEAYEHHGFGHDYPGQACRDGQCEHARHGVAGRGRHEHGIESFCLSFDVPLVWEKLAEAFDLLVQVHGERLLRIKGLVNVVGSEQPVVIHGVQHVFYPPGVLPAWPDDDHRSRIVFITRGVGAGQVERLMGPLLA